MMMMMMSDDDDDEADGTGHNVHRGAID